MFFRRTLLAIAFLLAAAQLDAAVTVTVNATANQHPIDARIYGAAWASPAAVTDLGLTLNRWGGNAASRYNWAFSTANRCKDYYFENIPEGSGSGANGASADQFISDSRNAGAQPVITIPLFSLLPKDRVQRCGYSIAKYGAQDGVDPYDSDCGNGLSGGNRMLHVNDPADTSATYISAHQANWVQHLVSTWGTAANGGVKYYSLDNEPSLWSFDHWDVHPDGSTYDEVWGKMADYGAAIKAKDPTALITGIEEWGWSGYFSSGIDQENWDNAQHDADRLSHGNVAYIDWLLQQAHAYEQAHGVRILDFATVHFYPQSGENSQDTSATTQGLRNRSTRSLWDPNYVDESWIGDTGIDGGKVRLIPRLKQWVANNYPGTKIGITEYNWGADGHINGGTAQADILGIFGREGLDMGVRWEVPPTGSYTYNAFKMYRNYDGSHSTFGDTSVSATGPDPDNVAAFAARRTSDGALTIMLIKKITGSETATVNLSNFVPARNAKRYQLDSANAIAHLADVAVSSSSISLTLPAQSITLLVVPAATAPGAPAIGTGTPGNGTATVSFTAPASDGGSNITGYTATCNPGGFTASGAASPLTVSGLTNGVTYSCSVVALNAAGTSAPSGSVNVTPTAGGPASLTAAATSTSNVALTWPTTGAANYEIFRSVNNSAFSLLITVGATSYNDGTVAPNTTYLYKVRPVGGAFSPVDAATTVIFIDDPLPPSTPVRATHLQQLRTAVVAMRAAAGLTTAPFTDPSLAAGTLIKAQHVAELRAGLDQARSLIGLPPLTYTNGTLTAVVVKAAHVAEIRNGVK